MIAIAMRTQVLRVCILFASIGAGHISLGQQIKINDSLALQSKPIAVKTKGGFSTILKFGFGDFSIRSGKKGWEKTTHEGKLFSANEVSESKRKFSFVFTGKDKDSAIVNAASNTIIDIYDPGRVPFATIGNADFVTIVGSKSNFIATILTNRDSIVWTLVMVQKGGPSIDPADAFAFEGGLTDGERKIDLKPVHEWSNGKKPMMSFGLPGYELWENGVAIAAVQAPMNTMLNKIVWIRDDVDPATRFIVATALAALIENIFMESQ